MLLNKRLAIDLGTANSLVYLVGQGIVLNEPTIVAVSVDDNKVLAVGNTAKEMLGRTPESIEVSKPLRSGVIADYAICEAILKYFINTATGRVRIVKPDVMVSVPSGVTSVESRAVLDATLSAGAKNAYLLPEPLAAAIGAELPIGDPSGNMIINSGGGTTEIAIISLGGLVVSDSVRVAGNSIDESISSYIRRKYGLVIGEKTAEDIKIQIGSALPLSKDIELEVRGRDSIAGLPKTIVVKSQEITEAITPVLEEMIKGVKAVLERTPPELSSDVMDKGIIMSGGTSLLKNIERFVTVKTGLPAHVVDDPLLCVVKGIAVALENIGVFEKSIIRR